jgi:hypothetical protein
MKGLNKLERTIDRNERDYNAAVKKLRLDNQILKAKVDHIIKTLNIKDNYFTDNEDEKPVNQKPKGKKKKLKISNNRK